MNRKNKLNKLQKKKINKKINKNKREGKVYNKEEPQNLW